MKSSKLFLVAIVALMMGAFALVGCEKAEEPAAGAETTATETPNTDDKGAETPAVDGETKTEEGDQKAPTDAGASTTAAPEPGAGDEKTTEGH